MFPQQFLQVYLFFVSPHCREFSDCRVTLSTTGLRFNKYLLPICQPLLRVLFLKSSNGRRILIFVTCWNRRCLSALPILRFLANSVQSPLHILGLDYHCSSIPPKDGEDKGLDSQVGIVHLFLLLFLLEYNKPLEMFSSFFWIEAECKELAVLFRSPSDSLQFQCFKILA